MEHKMAGLSEHRVARMTWTELGQLPVSRVGQAAMCFGGCLTPCKTKGRAAKRAEMGWRQMDGGKLEAIPYLTEAWGWDGPTS